MLDPEIADMSERSFDGLPVELTQFWQDSHDDENDGTGAKRFPYFILVDESNQHRDKGDCTTGYCCLTAVGHFRAYVCIPELGTKFLWLPADMLYLRSYSLGHQITKRQGPKRFSVVFP